MRRPILLIAPVLIAVAAGVGLYGFRRSPALPESPPPRARDLPAPTEAPAPATSVVLLESAPKPKPDEPPASRWKKEPDRARKRWAKALVEHPPTLTRDDVLVEIARIERMADGDGRIDAVRALFGSDQIDRTAADRLLALYDQSGPGEFRKVLFGALLFSTAGDYVAGQMLFRARSQPADEREYTYAANLTSRHAETWEFLCDSVPACRGEEGACRAALAVAGLAADYPAATEVPRLQSLLSQTTWPSARIYLFQALLATPGAEGLDGARKALLQERDEDVRRAVLRMRPGLGN